VGKVPWFPDFTSAVELVRQQTRAAGQLDPVGQYLAALSTGDANALETVWPGDVVVYDPRAGAIRGHHQLKQFVRSNQEWQARRHTRVETVATTSNSGRAVVEVVAHLNDDDRPPVAWPVAVVAESPDERSMVFRTYCSQWPVDGRRHLRPPILQAAGARPGDVIARYLAAFGVGDTAAVVKTFASDGYLREPIGPNDTHRGVDQLTALFTEYFAAGGGVDIECCVVTDDGVRCAVEYNCTRWGSHDLPPQAGIAIYERGPEGLLAAVRIYDDVEAPIGRS
jgi:ketosteroid isomerase-like protein